MKNKKIGISLVLYRETEKRFNLFISSLSSVLKEDYQIRVFQNSNHEFIIPDNIIVDGGNRNFGYGNGHNKNLKWFIDNEYTHVVISNTDIKFQTDLSPLFSFHKNISVLCPLILDQDLNQQKMVRALPTILDKLKSFIFSYPFYKIIEGDSEIIIPSFSGCFFVLNISNFLNLNESQLFDSNIFLYEEDTDLSRRLWPKRSAKLISKVKIVHNHDNGSKKNFKLLFLHIKSLVYYFNKWGYFDPVSLESRKYINKI